MPVKKVQKRVVKAPTVKKAVKAPAVKKSPGVKSTVCLEGYKISKAGRCVKDKKYQTIIATIPMAPPMPGAKKVSEPAPLGVKGLIAKFEQQKKGKMVPMKLREGTTITFGLAGPKKDGDLITL